MARDKLEKLWIGGGAVAALLVAGAVWTLAVSPEFDDADAVRTQAADTETQNIALQSNVTRLQQQYAGIGKLRNELVAVHAALPNDLAMSGFTQQIGAQAKAAHVSVQTLTAGAPAAMTAAPAAAASSTSTSTAAPASSPSSTTASAPSTYTIPVSIMVSGKPADELRFLHAVQLDGPRAALLTGATASDGNNGTTTLSLQMTVFVAQQAAAPTAATPTPTSTSTPTQTSTP
jgi:hypothetical protein